MLERLFQPVQGAVIWAYFLGAVVFMGIVAAVLLAVPQRLRKPVLLTVTFLGGLFYAVEFFWPVAEQADGSKGNFLTPYTDYFANNLAPSIGAFTVGLGVINLFQVHGKRLARGSAGWYNSLAFFIAAFAMFFINILQKAHPNSINKNLNTVLYNGGLAAMDSTMFSIIAFYIVSAAYRAFRVRSVEATMLLVTAIIVMLGQITAGQMLTAWIAPDSLLANLRIENIRNWILTVPNSAVVRAITFGLGVGSLAMSLRIWLGLERGSYFES